jgi:hypothetical protein
MWRLRRRANVDPECGTPVSSALPPEPSDMLEGNAGENIRTDHACPRCGESFPIRDLRGMFWLCATCDSEREHESEVRRQRLELGLPVGKYLYGDELDPPRHRPDRYIDV